MRHPDWRVSSGFTYKFVNALVVNQNFELLTNRIFGQVRTCPDCCTSITFIFLLMWVFMFTRP